MLNGSLLHRASRIGMAALAAVSATFWTAGSAPAMAAQSELWPNTSIRLTIVQWMPTKGVYERWDALSGEFTISQDGALTIPVIGRLEVGGLDNAGLAAKIATDLSKRIGLVNPPEATIVVVNYAPIYVVGDVKTPGTFAYRTGLTALQALAVSGGEARPTLDGATTGSSADLVAQLRSLENSVLRSRIRIARLQAELSDTPSDKLTLPTGLDTPRARSIYAQEQAIMIARAKLMSRQAKSFTELRDLLQAEIATLEKKQQSSEADIASVAKELRNIKSMVDKGVALPSRLSDLERLLRSYSAARLDLSTDVMRARQGMSEASRNLEGLLDMRRTELTSGLQSEQAILDELLLKQEATQKNALRLLETSSTKAPSELTYVISRREKGVMRQIPATTDSALQPGDVLRISRSPDLAVSESLAARPQPDAVAGNSQ